MAIFSPDPKEIVRWTWPFSGRGAKPSFLTKKQTCKKFVPYEGFQIMHPSFLTEGRLVLHITGYVVGYLVWINILQGVDFCPKITIGLKGCKSLSFQIQFFLSNKEILQKISMVIFCAKINWVKSSFDRHARNVTDLAQCQVTWTFLGS